jgi:hypothetical protein
MKKGRAEKEELKGVRGKIVDKRIAREEVQRSAFWSLTIPPS